MAVLRQQVIGGAVDGHVFEAPAYMKPYHGHAKVFIIDEAEFVDQAAYRAHYENTASRMAARLAKAAARGDVRADVEEVHAWAIMGMNVFLGLRYGVWDDSRPAEEVGGLMRLLRAYLRGQRPPLGCGGAVPDIGVALDGAHHWWRGLTLRHCLSHTAGMGFNGEDLVVAQPVSVFTRMLRLRGFPRFSCSPTVDKDLPVKKLCFRKN